MKKVINAMIYTAVLRRHYGWEKIWWHCRFENEQKLKYWTENYIKQKPNTLNTIMATYKALFRLRFWHVDVS